MVQFSSVDAWCSKACQWVCNISLANGVVIGTNNESKKTREEIEIDGFFECFKLLDKKLNHE